MKKKLLKLLFLLTVGAAFSQRSVKIGSGVLDLSKKNETSLTQQRSVKHSGPLYKVMKFKSIPTKAQRALLKARGIQLLSYIQDNLFYVSVNGVHKSYSRKINDNSVEILGTYTVDPIWKISEAVYHKDVPSYAKTSRGLVKLDVQYFDVPSASNVEQVVKSIGGKIINHQKEFNSITIAVAVNKVKSVASHSFVKWVDYVSPADELYNVQGRTLNRASVLNNNTLGNRGLNGEGMIVGIWDSSIENHPDLGNRLISKESQSIDDHGQHVSGTVAGAGLIDPKAKGMASKAKVLGWNFNMQQNGLSAQQEMLKSAKEYGIRITQNSYGIPVSKEGICTDLYPYTNSAAQLDLIVNKFPTLSHIFSVGNDQAHCLSFTNSRYYTSSKRAKNAIFVGAINENGKISDFSSWGPTDDGRLIPHVSAFGVDTYSTVYNNTYGKMSGTSMACPVVSGVMTLVYQRYKQLYGTDPLASLAKAAMLNTADDKGTLGPDYQYGFGAVDAVKTVELLEKKQFFNDKIAQSESKNHTIKVPSGVKQLKVMLVWSDKAGKANNKALINDLDLSLSHGGQVYLPWVLDPANPAAEATRKQDHLNNQEQITIDNPKAGSYFFSVTGTEIPEDAQDYSLVYHFVTDELSLVYPNGGEKLNPEEEIVVMWSSYGYKGDQSLELSTDNGRTYKVIADHIPATENTYNFKLPSTITGKAFIRVVQNGTSDKSDAAFAIMSTPKNLKYVSSDDCGLKSVLNWDAIEGVEKYNVLRANVNEGTYTKIAESSTNSFDLSGQPYGRNIYSVTAVSKDGVESERAIAAIAELSAPVNLSEIKLPFEENFDVYPSKYFKITGGKGINHQYISSPFEYSTSHSIVFTGNDKTTSWNPEGDLFENNPDDVGVLKLCNLNTADHKGKLWLRLIATIGSSAVKTSKMRVKVDGEVVKNSEGGTEIDQIPLGSNVMYWDLTSYVGKNVSLSVETALHTAKDSLLIGHIKLFKPIKDASIKFKAPEKSKTLTNAETIEVIVKNLSGDPISNVPVSYQINDGKVVKELIAGPIAPFKSFKYQFQTKADLSEKDVLFNITASVGLEGDENSKNDKVTDATTRFGDYHVMPETKSTSNVIIAKQEPKGFTDNQGISLNYTSNINAGVVIRPETPGKFAKIKFVDFDVEKGYDKVTIRNGSYAFSEKIATLSGSDLEMPLEFIASNFDRSLYVEFISDSEVTKPGWYAEVSEVSDLSKDPSNTFVIKYIANDNGNYTSEQKVSVRIANQSAQEQKDVKVRYRLGGEEADWVTDVIPSIAATTETTFEFEKGITVAKVGAAFKLEVQILNEDAYLKDNKVEREILNDFYCFGTLSKDYDKPESFIKEVAKGEVSNKTSQSNSESTEQQFYRDTVLPIYKSLSNEAISVTVGNPVDGGNVSVWVDWNNNKDYSDDAVYTVTTNAEQTVYEIPVTFKNEVAEGKYFARVRAVSNADVDPCSTDYSILGEVEDYTVEVIEQYPISSDLELVSTNLQDGESLSSSETVSVVVKNNSGKEVSSFTVNYKVNGGELITELVNQKIAPLGTLEYTFDKKADLSVAGLYKFDFEVLIDADENPENNVLSKSVLNQVPSKDGFFALDFDGEDDIVKVGTLNDVNLKSFTYEVWMNPYTYGEYGSYIGFGRLFQGKNATIFLHGERNTNYPDHSLVISMGGGSFHTKENSIDLNRWQHIAISFDEETSDLKVFVDGVAIDVVEKKPIVEIEDNTKNVLYIGNSPKLDRSFEGMMDQVRIWQVARSEQQVLDNLHKTVGTADNLLAEFTFNEGHFNKTTISGNIVATIENADYDKTERGIWKKPTVEFNSFEVQGKVTDFEELDKNYVKAELAQGTDITKVIADFTTNFKNASVKVLQVDQVSGETTNDFSNSLEKPLAYQLSASYLGKTLSTTFKVALKVEENPVAELLTFGIPSINAKADPVTHDIIFTADSQQDLSALIPEFTVSQGAKVFVNDVEITSGNATLDFSKTVVIKVLASNQRTYNLYTVTFKRSQTLTWGSQELAKVYGDPIFELKAVASSNQPVFYESSNADVISVGYNKATIKGVGTVTITAVQPGNNLYGATERLSKEFVVTKGKLIAKAEDKSVDYLDAIPELTIAYDGFAYQDDASSITEPKITTVAEQGSLAGTYDIVLSGGDAKNYDLELANGTLTINSVPLYTVTFAVVQEGSPIAQATIELNGKTYKTDAEGKLELSLKDGQYNYTVVKEGKEGVSGILDVKGEDKVVTIEMINELPVFNVNYLTDGNGYISGEPSQQVKKGKDANEVIALPNEGYDFVKWSDGLKEATRLDVNVQSDLEFKAEFKLKTFTLTYLNKSDGGTLSGELVQEVAFGGDATAITATPKEGYAFYGWSDGLKDNPRIDKTISEDIEVEAIFEKVYGLPYVQNFDSATGTQAPEDWKNISNIKKGQIWEFKKETSTGRSLIEDNVAAIMDSDSHGALGSQDTDLVSPLFDLSDYDFVELSFIHFYKSYQQKDKGTISYSTDGGVTWAVLDVVTDTEGTQKYKKVIPEVAGKSQVRFKWNYSPPSWAWYWLVDNITISNVPTKDTYKVTYLADENGTIQGEAIQTLEEGSTTTPVTALANPGYEFVKWSDGVTEVTRTDLVTSNITVTAIFELKKYQVTFEIVDQAGNPVKDAEITIGDKVYVTNSEGISAFELPNSDYNYVIFYEDNQVSSGSFVVNEEPVKIKGVLSILGVLNPELASKVRLYPNPFVTNVFINNAKEVQYVYLYSISGKLLNLFTNTGSELMDINTKGLSSGTYILKLTTRTGKVNTVKVVKK